MNYREQFYEGEIDGKTLLDVIDEKEAEVRALREDRATLLEARNDLIAGNDALHSELADLRAELEALRARVVVPGNLLERCREILEWQATGILKGDALRSYCQSKIWGGDPSALRMGEGETAQEAYRFIDELSRLNGKAVSEGLLRGVLEYADMLLYELKSLLDYSGYTGDERKHEDADYLELRALLGEGEEHE